MVRERSYGRWARAVELESADTRLVFVPEIGRIMYYGPKAGPNLLWNNSVAPRPGEYANWGGDKLWPAPQSLWGWPPDPDLDGSPWTLERTGEGFVARSPVSRRFGIRFERTVELDGSRATIQNVMVREQTFDGSLAVWQVCQVPQPEYVALRPFLRQGFERGYVAYGEDASVYAQAEELEGEVRFRRNRKRGIKFGGWHPAGEVWGLVNGYRITMASPLAPGATYPDDGKAQQLYLAEDPAAYAELELTAPLESQGVGERQTLVVTWDYERG